MVALYFFKRRSIHATYVYCRCFASMPVKTFQVFVTSVSFYKPYNFDVKVISKCFKGIIRFSNQVLAMKYVTTVGGCIISPF